MGGQPKQFTHRRPTLTCKSFGPSPPPVPHTPKAVNVAVVKHVQLRNCRLAWMMMPGHVVIWLVLSENPARVVTFTLPPRVGILLRLLPAAGREPPSEHTELRRLLVGEGGSFSTGPVVERDPCELPPPSDGSTTPNTSTGSPPRCSTSRTGREHNCGQYQLCSTIRAR